MIRKISIWIVILIIVSFSSYGAGRYQEVLVTLVDDINIIANGEQVQLRDTDGSVLVPINYKGRTYLPVREVADLLNYEIGWDHITKTISIMDKNAAEEEESGYASIAATAYSAGKVLRDKDYKTLAELAHPVKGIRFSINGKVEGDIDIVIKKMEFESNGIGEKKYTWGVEDGSPVPMIKTVDIFMDRFNKDFENPVRTGWGERVTGYGIQDQPQNSTRIIEGGESLYTGCEFVEYYFEGTSGQEFDWDSYIMVFEKYLEKYYLVGIVHNYWLI